MSTHSHITRLFGVIGARSAALVLSHDQFSSERDSVSLFGFLPPENRALWMESRREEVRHAVWVLVNWRDAAGRGAFASRSVTPGGCVEMGAFRWNAYLDHIIPAAARACLIYYCAANFILNSRGQRLQWLHAQDEVRRALNTLTSMGIDRERCNQIAQLRLMFLAVVNAFSSPRADHLTIETVPTPEEALSFIDTPAFRRLLASPPGRGRSTPTQM